MRKAIKPAVFCACLVPFCWLFYLVWTNNLGPDPGEALAKESGEWTFRFLLATLAITPVQQFTGWRITNRYRRMIGLFSLFYASAHFLVYLMFVLGFRWGTLYTEILERPYITVGFSAFVILVALGITSPKAMLRKLGKNWKRLHRLIYVAAVLAMIHMIWILRSDFGEALIYGTVLTLLLGYRAVNWLRKRNRKLRLARGS
ncbi:MAG: protein-methionine-sulfoxide reductase heme-binding subunit MsrQ [Gammaproteobacteria bacterium]|nr:sulfoxide reductase heme-binding subunit YedZ [Pseudomonadales bacterium]